jgi:hypothetical protein
MVCVGLLSCQPYRKKSLRGFLIAVSEAHSQLTLAFFAGTLMAAVNYMSEDFEV